MAARTRDHDSAGRLLRAIEDCELYHMEAAIASLERVKTGIRSDSLLNPSGGDDVDLLERTSEGRVLSLSDHKRIARLQAALTTVAIAYDGGNGVEASREVNSNRNLVCTVAGAAIMRATRDCSASRTNCCIWGSQAEKLHFLLDWMVNRERNLARSDHDFVRQLMLEWIQPTAEKQNQLAACLALFELLQRCRQRLTSSVSGIGSSYLLDSHSNTTQSVISLTRTFLCQLDREALQEPLYRHWRQELSPVVLSLLDHSSYRVHLLALSCLPSLDSVACIAGLCAKGMLQAENDTVTSALGHLFSTSTQRSLEVMVTWFVDACQFGSPQVRFVSKRTPHDWNDYAAGQIGNIKEEAGDDEGRKEQQEQLFSLCFGPNGWSKHVRSTNARSQVLSIMLLKVFGSPRDTLLLRMLREFVGCGWVDRDIFEAIGKQLTTHMMNLQRLTEDLLNDNSASAAKTVEGLLFSRLAPLLVLRMLPRSSFGAIFTQTLLCGREDLNHLNEYIDRRQHFDGSDSQSTDSTDKILYHILARSVVDPLEFKEVKMLATEVLAKFPPHTVLPFVFAHLLAFLQEAGLHHQGSTSLNVSPETIPDGCGLVTAKLMVYYLNRVFAEDEHAYKDGDTTTRVLVVLTQIMGIPCRHDSNVDVLLLADLQRGCIDCVGLILSRLDAEDNSLKTTKMPTDSASSLVNLLLTWVFETKNAVKIAQVYEPRVQKLLQSVWSEAQYGELPLQVRICCCNVLLSAISRLENSVLERWKSQGFISRVALATESSSDEDVVAGGLQVIFSFLYKASELLSMENSNDLQMVRNCFEATVSRLESTRRESVAMSGLKVVGALVSKLPSFVGTLPPTEVQRLIDGCLVSVRDRRLSPVVSELAQSLLQAMTPP
ncbi:hypothetical protein PR001_g19870 [Phytophthora rubi]|uniref:Uncharacterized protein n=1 Tax=Phytophthora rubi TaxID=129364 RepID=A0A6A3JN41_9STRA|nr:hypothetical protein PR001_g19870 [Phytophthora rubi]